MPLAAILLLVSLTAPTSPPTSQPASAPASRPTSPPTSRPATAPVIRTLTEVSAVINRGERLTILLDTTEAPDLHDWSLRAAHDIVRWYPEIAARLASPGFTPPRDIRVTFRPLPGKIAYASGNRLTVGAEWVRRHPDDFGMIAHELTHIIQSNRPGAPHWLVEGIADYIRYYVIEPGSRRAAFDPARSTYARGYQPAAALLNWLETRAPGTVARLQRLLREGAYTPEKFHDLTGNNPEAHWAAFVQTLPTTRPKP